MHSRVKKRFAQAGFAAVLAACVAAVTGCSGGPGSGSGPDGAPDCDVPALFQQRCGGNGCHQAPEGDLRPAAELDLVSPDVAERISNKTATQGGGVVVSPGRPEGSELWDRVQPTPMSGARMPLASLNPLPASDLDCIRDWISGLNPPMPEMDAGVPDDCPECECPNIGESEACFSAAGSLKAAGVCKEGTRTCEPTPTASYWGPCVDEIIPSPEKCSTPEDEDCNGTSPTTCSETWSFAVATAATSQAVRSVAVDSLDNVLVAGDFGLYREPDEGTPPGGLPNGKIDLGGGILTADGAEDGFYKDDVFLAKYDKNGNHLWSQRFGDTSNQTSTQVIVDADDNVILLGRAFGKIDFGNGVILDAAGTDDIFVAKFDGTTGTVIWSVIFGGISPDRAERMAVDRDGDVWVAGTFTDTATFGDKGPFTSTGVRDGIVLEIDGDTAAVRTAIPFGGGSTDATNNKVGDNYGFGIGVYTDNSTGTPTDFIYVTGYFSNTMRIAGGPELTSEGSTDIFVAKLDAAGGHVWSRAYGSSLEDVAHDLVVDPSNGSVTFTGFFQETIDFGGDAITSAGLNDIFLAKLDADGNHLFSKAYGDGMDQRNFGSFKTNSWTSLDIDAEGNIFLGGPLVGSANFGASPIVSPGENKMDAFLAKLDPAGNHIDSKRYGDTGTQLALDIAVANSGHVLLVGRFYTSSMAFDPVTGSVRGIGITAEGISSAGDGFVARLVVD
jgi:hypothetical protein